MKKCVFCGHADVVKKRVQYIYKHNGNLLMVNDVPCEECTFCGEQYFEACVLKKIEKEFQSITLSGKKAKQEIVLPVENYADLEAAY